MSRSREVTEAVGLEGETPAQRRERLQKIVSTPSEKELAQAALAEMDREEAERARARLQDEAKKRLLDIARAYGGLAEAMKLDDRRLLEAARKLRDIALTQDEHFSKVTMLQHEAAALCEVFGLPTPSLPRVVPPATRPEVVEAFTSIRELQIRDSVRIVPTMDWETTAQGLVPVRRNYGELDGTEGFDLIRRKLGK